MEWLSENWFWLVVGILFVVLHLFGHGGHGAGERRRGSGDGADRNDHGKHAQ